MDNETKLHEAYNTYKEAEETFYRLAGQLRAAEMAMFYAKQELQGLIAQDSATFEAWKQLLQNDKKTLSRE